MEIELCPANDEASLVFSGAMTRENSREIENCVIGAMRRHPRLKVDLSAVDAIDPCGLYLLGVLKAYGGNAVRFVAASPVIRRAVMQLPATAHHAELRQSLWAVPELARAA